MLRPSLPWWHERFSCTRRKHGGRKLKSLIIIQQNNKNSARLHATGTAQGTPDSYVQTSQPQNPLPATSKPPSSLCGAGVRTLPTLVLVCLLPCFSCLCCCLLRLAAASFEGAGAAQAL